MNSSLFRISFVCLLVMGMFSMTAIPWQDNFDPVQFQMLSEEENNDGEELNERLADDHKIQESHDDLWLKYLSLNISALHNLVFRPDNSNSEVQDPPPDCIV